MSFSNSTHHGAVIAKRTISSPFPSSLPPALVTLTKPSPFSSLAPKYEELASLYPSTAKVTIAKVDATANDVPDEIQGFPTIKLFPAGAKSEPLTYSGSRTIEDLAAFVKENGKYKIDAYEGKNETDNDEEADETPLAEGMGEAARAATESVKSAATEATEAVKSAVKDTDGEDGQEHDEL